MENQTAEANTENQELAKNEKTIAIIAYLTIIGLIIAFVMNQDKKGVFSTYHIKQSLGIALTGIALGIVGMVPILGWIASILGTMVMIFLCIMGFINALNGEQKIDPILVENYK